MTRLIRRSPGTGLYPFGKLLLAACDTPAHHQGKMRADPACSMYLWVTRGKGVRVSTSWQAGHKYSCKVLCKPYNLGAQVVSVQDTVQDRPSTTVTFPCPTSHLQSKTAYEARWKPREYLPRLVPLP